jgi:hypothetical protein
MGAGMTTGTITIGGTGLQTGTIGIGTGTGAQTISLGTGGTGAKTINVGTGVAGDITVGFSSATATGLRIASSRVVSGNKIAHVDCADAACSPTVTQVLDSAGFIAAASVNRAFTLPTAAQTGGDGAGLVAGLPGTAAVGDVFSFVISNSGASTVTVTAGTGATIVGNAVIGAAETKVVVCRVTAITANSETITCL